MEFFQEVPASALDVAQLKKLVSIENLTKLCASIDEITSSNANDADIYCLWGAFNVHREEIRYGVRFSLLNCPHALAWTVTWHEAEQRIIVHCTIDSRESSTDPDFIESIDIFIADWARGIAGALSQN